MDKNTDHGKSELTEFKNINNETETTVETSVETSVEKLEASKQNTLEQDFEEVD